MGEAKALNVKMELDHLWKDSHNKAAHTVHPAPVILLRSEPTTVTRVLSLPSHPPTPVISSELLPAKGLHRCSLKGRGEVQGEESSSSSFRA